MKRWKKTINIKQFLTEEEDFDSLQDSMNKIADLLEDKLNAEELNQLEDYIHLDDFRNLPEIETLDEANTLLFWLYDYADAYNIWLGFKGE